MNYFIKDILKKTSRNIDNFKNKTDDLSKIFTMKHEKIESEEMDDEIELERESFKSEEDFKRSCCHEAGHALIAKLNDVETDEILISATGSFVALDSEGKTSADDLKKLVSIMYAGILAEILVFGNGSSGFMGGEDADMETANDYLKEYVIITERNLSLTGLEEEEIKKIMIKKSKEIEKETKTLLSSNKEELLKLMDKIMEDNRDLLEDID